MTIRRVKKGGRGHTGQLFVRHRGGGHKQRLRIIDFKRGRKDIPATVLRIEYDPSHSARIALIQYEDGVLSYILAPLSTRPGDKVIASTKAAITPGNCLPLSEIPIGTIVHNIEMRPGAGGQINRAAGTFSVVLSKDPQFVTLKLKSTEIRKLDARCWATIGQLSNIERGSEVWGKAGAMVWRGFRPRVRGNAMLPNRHPHGGGVSKRHTKRPPVTVWGKPAQDFKSRWKKLPSWKDILVRKNSMPKPKGYRKFNYQR